MIGDNLERVSIIIAAYNIEKYINRCMDSCINQTYKNIEIIVVNDGSRDNTLINLNKYKEYENVKVITKKNGGLIEARKSGYSEATGKYILFIDGDDWLHLKAIEELYKRAEDTCSDIVWYRYWFAYDNNLLMKKEIEKEFDCINNDEFLKGILTEDILPSIWSKFIKREFIEKNNITFPDEISFAEDLAFSVSLGIHKPKTAFLNKRLYYYYQRDNAMTKTISSKLLDIAKATNFIKVQLQKNNLYIKYKDEFEYCAYIHNLYYRNDVIFKNKNEFSKKLYTNWKDMKIDIENNKYFKHKFNSISRKGRIMTALVSKNYYVGVLINRVI
ncbi:MAG: glycosyltransferase family 2 protein [Clostridium sp.]|uniref:glycosyltransferase family 2 protein n=1 Tax=Clostridium sp. TaxID=1506 RepID=UPI003F40DAD4